MRKFQVKTLTAAVCLVNGFSLAHATNTTMSQRNLRHMINQIVTQKTHKLQNEVDQLQGQVKSLKTELRNARSKEPQVQTTPQKSKVASHQQERLLAKPTGSVLKEIHQRLPENHVLSFTPNQVHLIHTLTTLYFGGTPVITSPYIGQHSVYDGSDLIVNAPSVNLDLRLLKQKQALENALASQGMHLPEHPLIELSGKVEGDAIYSKVSPGTTHNDIDLASSELDIFADMNPWVYGYMSFSYDDAPTVPQRSANSRIFLNKGFVTVGNLNYSPFYGTIGQVFVPFGRYASYFVTAPLTELLARTKARTVIIGGHPKGKNGFYGQIYGFRSDTRSNGRNQGGANVGYHFGQGRFSSDIATSYITTMADADGMQSTGAPGKFGFTGFGVSSTTENLRHNVPGINIHGDINYDHYTVIGEYLSALRSFSPANVTFNGRGARPQALHVEGIYSFNIHGKPSSFGIEYGFTRQALAFFLPKDQVGAVFNISLWRDTIESIEYKHDINYAKRDRASGAGSRPFGPTYDHADTVTGQIGIYF